MIFVPELVRVTLEPVQNVPPPPAVIVLVPKMVARTGVLVAVVQPLLVAST